MPQGHEVNIVQLTFFSLQVWVAASITLWIELRQLPSFRMFFIAFAICGLMIGTIGIINRFLRRGKTE